MKNVYAMALLSMAQTNAYGGALLSMAHALFAFQTLLRLCGSNFSIGNEWHTDLDRTFSKVYSKGYFRSST